MTTCILADREPGTKNEHAVALPSGLIPYWRQYSDAYAHANALGAPRASVLEFDCLDDALHHIGVPASRLVEAASVN